MGKLFKTIDTEILDFGYEFERQAKILYEKKDELSEDEFVNYVKSLATWSCYADRILNMQAGQIIQHHGLNIVKAQDDLDVEMELILNAIGYTAKKQGDEWVIASIPREVRAEVWEQAKQRGERHKMIMSTGAFGLPDAKVAKDGWKEMLMEDKDIKETVDSAQKIINNLLTRNKK